MTESFAELFEQSQTSLNNLKSGAIVTGTVEEIRADVVVVNVGLKSEGVIDINQFRNEQGEIEVAVGDIVKVALEAVENGFGETVLSRDKAKKALVWDELETVSDDFRAAVRSKTQKGGQQVPYHGSFCGATPSVMRDMEWYLRRWDEVLGRNVRRGA